MDIHELLAKLSPRDKSTILDKILDGAAKFEPEDESDAWIEDWICGVIREVGEPSVKHKRDAARLTAAFPGCAKTLARMVEEELEKEARGINASGPDKQLQFLHSQGVEMSKIQTQLQTESPAPQL